MIKSFPLRLLLWAIIGYMSGRIMSNLGIGPEITFAIFFLLILPIGFIIMDPNCYNWFKTKVLKHESKSE